MISFLDFITEAKQVGNLYHFTTIKNLHSMLDSEEQFHMKSHNGGISTTRNYQLSTDHGQEQHKELHHSKGYVARLTLDGDKISQHHKVKPVRGLTFNDPDVFNHEYNDSRVSRHEHENEESICSSRFKAKKYIKRVDILADSKEIHDHYHNELKHKLDAAGIEHGISKSWHPVNESHVDNFDKYYLILVE